MGKTANNLIFEIKKEAMERGYTLTMPTSGISMFPLLRAKDRIVIARCAQDKLKRGDLILYIHTQESSVVYVAHRLVRKIKNSSGYTLITKGDAAIHCDKPINPEAVMGKIIKIKTPYFSIYLEGIMGRIINALMFLISMTRVVGLGLWVLKKVKFT